MGKRAPKVKAGKVEKTEKVEKEEAREEKAEQIDEEPSHFEVFTPKFYETLDSFKNFYREVLTLKSKEQGSDLSEEFREVSKRVSSKLEEESGKILKEELSEVEQWVADQQGLLAEAADKIEEAYKRNSESLANTGSFSDEEIRKQLLPVQAKIDQKRSTFDSYGALLQRSRDIYQ
jgi:Mg2+ and Co2+ transporter CorA